MPFFELIVLGAAWPALGPWSRRALAAGAAALSASHLAAFALFVAGMRPGLLTLQTPALPWETLVVLPGAWALLTWAGRYSAAAAARSGSAPVST